MGKWWAWENCGWSNVWLPTYLFCRRIKSSYSSFFLIILYIYLFLLSFCVDCLFGFSTYPPPPFFKARKGNNIIYNHSRCGVFRLPPQTWYFFNWSMLVGSVKWFASKSISHTAPREHICLIIYRPSQFCLNFSFASWTRAQISFNTKSPNFKSLVLIFFSKTFLCLLWYPWMRYRALSLFSSSMHNWSYLLCNQSTSRISLSSTVLSERTSVSLGRTTSIPYTNE